VRLRHQLTARFSPNSNVHRNHSLSFRRAGSRIDIGGVGPQADLVTPDDTWADDVGTLQTSYMRGGGVVLRYPTRDSPATYTGLSSTGPRGSRCLIPGWLTSLLHAPTTPGRTQGNGNLSTAERSLPAYVALRKFSLGLQNGSHE
jgi:hypothetical protein